MQRKRSLLKKFGSSKIKLHSINFDGDVLGQIEIWLEQKSTLEEIKILRTVKSLRLLLTLF